MKRCFIKDFSVGERIDDCFVAVDATLNPFRPESGRSGRFLRFTIVDRTGSLPAIMWENGEAVFQYLESGNTLVQVRGNVGQYRGEPQVVVESVQIVEENDVDPSWFLPKSPRPLQEMLSELKQVVLSIKTHPLSGLLTNMFQDEAFYQAFIEAPAAKSVHHAYLGGLLEHSLETVAFAEVIADQFPKYVNRELLITGALIHDCGKIKEYSWHKGIDVTNTGRLFGHIVFGAEIVNDYWPLPEPKPAPEIKCELLHMVLSHHGCQEWGSPQPPKTINAFALHHADYLSAQIEHFQGVLGGTDKRHNCWTAKDFILGRRLYRGFLPLEDD